MKNRVFKITDNKIYDEYSEIKKFKDLEKKAISLGLFKTNSLDIKIIKKIDFED